MITQHQFKRIIVNYLKSKGLDNSELEVDTKDIMTASTDRLVFISELEDEKIGFAIRSLQEYFAALGFIRNAANPESRFTQVATNAYWSNTVLFIVGFIADHNTKLLPFIESLCSELNGSVDDPDGISLGALIKLGSWLSLDILSEGIFRGDRFLENKFSQFLKPLFDLPYIDRHVDLNKLPERVIKKWVVQFLSINLFEKKENNTSWRIAASFYKEHSEILELVQKAIPSHPQEQFAILRILVEAGINDEFVMLHLKNLLSPSLGHLWLEFLIDTQNPRILQLLSNAKLPKAQKRMWLDLVFLLYLNGDRDLQIAFKGLNLASSTYQASQIRPLISYLKEIKINITNSYTYKIIKTNIVDYGAIEIWLLAADDLDSGLVYGTLEFLWDGSYNRYELLMRYLESLEQPYRNAILNILKQQNSFFELAFRSSQLEPPDFEQLLYEINLLTESEINRSLINKITYNKYACVKQLSNSGILEGIRTYINEYFKFIDKPVVLTEFHIMFLSALPKLDSREIVQITEEKRIIQFYIQAISKCKESISDLLSVSLPYFILSFYFLTKAEIAGLLSKSLYFNSKPILFSHSSLKPDLLLVDQLVSKFGDVIRLQIMLGEERSYRLFFQAMTLSNSWNPQDIPFREILADNENLDCYRSVLLLLFPQFDEEHYQVVQSVLLFNEWCYSNQELRSTLLYALKYVSNTPFVEKAFILIYKLFNGHDHSFDIEFFNIAYRFLGSKPTFVDQEQLIDFDVL